MVKIAKITKDKKLSEKLKKARSLDGLAEKSMNDAMAAAFSKQAAAIVIENNLWNLDLDSSISILIHATYFLEENEKEEIKACIDYIASNFCSVQKTTMIKLKTI